MCDVVLFVLLQCRVVVADRFVIGFKVEVRHKDIIANFGETIKQKMSRVRQPKAIYGRTAAAGEVSNRAYSQCIGNSKIYHK